VGNKKTFFPVSVKKLPIGFVMTTRNIYPMVITINVTNNLNERIPIHPFFSFFLDRLLKL